VSLGLGALGVVAAVDLIRHAEATDESVLAASLVFGSLAAGGLAFAAGVALWRGTMGLTLRVAGWMLIVLSLAMPSTMTLALPFASVLVVGTRRFRSRGGGARPRPAAVGS
jgi:hypothetical protein